MSLSIALLLILLGLALLFWLGPRMPIDRRLRDWEPEADLPSQLTREEAAQSGVWPYARKEIIWAGARGAMTDYAVVYIHGWQATKAEIRPLPDDLARALGANLYFTRMTGHGQGAKTGPDAGQPLAEATFNDWYNDLYQAVQVGRRLGREVILVGTSNGGGLILSALADRRIMQGVALILLTSPLVSVAGRLDRLFTRFPFTGRLARWVKGPRHDWTARASNAAHARHWTTDSPIGSLVPVTAVVRAVAQVDLSCCPLPLVVAYGANDRTVSAAHIRRLLARWRGPVASLALTETDDPDHHVIAGEILAPAIQAQVSAWAVAEVRKLLKLPPAAAQSAAGSSRR